MNSFVLRSLIAKRTADRLIDSLHPGELTGIYTYYIGDNPLLLSLSLAVG